MPIAHANFKGIQFLPISAPVTQRMKVLMVVYITLFPQCLGKYYLIKTKDKVSAHPYKSEDGMDYSNDDEKCEAETLIYEHFNESQLYEFENLSPDNQAELVESMDEVIDNTQNGKSGNDYNLDLIAHIKEITLGSENLLNSINSLLSSVLESKKPICKRYGSKKSLESKKIWRCKKNLKGCKKSKNSNKSKRPGKSNG